MFNRDILVRKYKDVVISALQNRLINGATEPNSQILSNFISTMNYVLRAYIDANLHSSNTVRVNLSFKDSDPGRALIKKVVVTNAQGCSMTINYTKGTYKVIGYDDDEQEIIYDCIEVVDQIAFQEVYVDVMAEIEGLGYRCVKQDWIAALKNFVYLYRHYVHELIESKDFEEAQALLETSKNSYWQSIYNLETQVILGIADILDDAGYQAITVTANLQSPINFWTYYEKDSVPLMEVNIIELLHKDIVYRYLFASHNKEIVLLNKPKESLIDEITIRKITGFLSFSATIFHSIIEESL